MMESKKIGSLAVPSGHLSQNLLLDSAIRDWVVLPLLIIMVAAGLLRHYVSILLQPAKLKKIPYIEYRVRNALARASRLRSASAGFLSRVKWEGRRLYWAEKEKGYLKEETDWIDEEKEAQELEQEQVNSDGKSKNSADDVMNPMSMMADGMKGQIVFYAQNMIMMNGISYFFQGYILLKVPFPLTQGFKMMFQRGLDLSSLDTSYVSSVSWYFLVMFGLRAFFSLVIGGSGRTQEHVESELILCDLGYTSGQGGPVSDKFDTKAAIKEEIENLEIVRHKSFVDDAEKRILGKRYPKKKKIDIVGGNPGDDIFSYSKNVGTHTGGKSKTGSSKKKTA